MLVREKSFLSKKFSPQNPRIKSYFPQHKTKGKKIMVNESIEKRTEKVLDKQTGETVSPHAGGAAAAPKAPQKPKQISVSELVKMINAPKPEKPLEKEPVWSIILVITGAIFAAATFFISAVVAYYYFRSAVVSFILTVLLGISASLFILATTFMLRQIEKGIRQIKTKL